MRRALLLASSTIALIAALSLTSAAIAQADNCTIGTMIEPGTVSNLVYQPQDIAGYCGQRWYAQFQIQYESGGSWYSAGSGPVGWGFTVGTGNENCHNISTIGNAYCWGTDDGSGFGYFGAGNTKNFRIWNLNNDGSPKPCLYRWRNRVDLYDYNNQGVSQASKYSPTTPIDC